MPTASAGGPAPTEGEIIIADTYIPWSGSRPPAWSMGTAPPPRDRADMLNPRIVSPRMPLLNTVKGHHILQPAGMEVRHVPPEVASHLLEHVRQQGPSTYHQSPVSCGQPGLEPCLADSASSRPICIAENPFAWGPTFVWQMRARSESSVMFVERWGSFGTTWDGCRRLRSQRYRAPDISETGVTLLFRTTPHPCPHVMASITPS